jgi:manganese/zinc/iron transport system permease protein
MNPYVGQEFISFFKVLVFRLLRADFSSLFSDELQMAVLIAISISCALIGSFLVLKKMTMLANALSHTLLLGIVVVFLISPSEGGLVPIPALMVAGGITGLLTAFLTQVLQRSVRVQEDASIGLVFSSFFALSVLLISLFSRNAHVGLELIMGNVDGLVLKDLYWVWVVMGLNIGCFFIWYRGYQLSTFDELMARVLQFSPTFYTYLLMTQTSVTCISSFRSVGVFMVLALLVVPTLTVRLFIHSLKKLMVVSAAYSSILAVVGVALSRHLLTYYDRGFSTAGVLVTLHFILFLIAACCKLTFCKARIYSMPL